MVESKMLRPVGYLERASTSRHSIGYYRNVIVTARYRLPVQGPDGASLREIVASAVSQVVPLHPALNVGIVDEHTKNPYFVRLDEVDVDRCIEWVSGEVGDLGADSNYQSLIKVVEKEHGQCFPGIHSRPAWRLTITEAGLHTDDTISIYACFIFHHAIGDGLSGKVFHHSLLKALRNTINVAPGEHSHIIQVPGSLTLAPPVEKLINFKLTWTYLISKILREFGPSWMFPPSTAWTGGLVSMPSVEDYRSRIRVLSYQAPEVAKCLTACRAHECTLTGLLHGIMVSSLSKYVPDAHAFSAATPYSLRGLTGSSMTKDIAVQISALSSVYSSLGVQADKEETPTFTVTDQIWTIAQKFSADMKSELANLPTDNLIGMLGYVNDWHGMWKSKLGQERECTYEISNVGAFVDDDDRNGDCKIEQIIFSQPGIVAGAALGLNVASVKGALLSISFTWQDGILDEDLVKNIVADVDKVLKELAGVF